MLLLLQMYLSVISEWHESLFRSARAFAEQYRSILWIDCYQWTLWTSA